LPFGLPLSNHRSFRLELSAFSAYFSKRIGQSFRSEDNEDDCCEALAWFSTLCVGVGEGEFMMKMVGGLKVWEIYLRVQAQVIRNLGKLEKLLGKSIDLSLLFLENSSRYLKKHIETFRTSPNLHTFPL
jgi:hypothetical protein